MEAHDVGADINVGLCYVSTGNPCQVKQVRQGCFHHPRVDALVVRTQG